MKPSLALDAAVGTTLASMFFYPLFSSLAEMPYFLHWTWANSAELALAWILMAVLRINWR